MNARVIAAFVLALAGASSHGATRYDFSYSGLYYDASFPEGVGRFDPDAYFGGYFVGEDTNGDGSFQSGELTDLAFTTARNTPDGLMDHVIGPNTRCLRCWLDSFTYTPGGELAFHAWTEQRMSRQSYRHTGYLFEAYGDYWNSLTVTGDTIVNVSAVPEPATGIMLMAGLACLARIARRNSARR